MQSAVEYIKANADVQTLLKVYNAGGNEPYNDEIRMCCPIHKGKNSSAFVFNTSNKLWFCFTQCHTGGDIFDFVMKMEGITFRESVLRLAEIFKLDITNMEVIQRPDDLVRETKRWINESKKTFRSSPILEYDISQLGQLYPINSYRCFNRYTLEHFDIQYCQSNKRIVVPIHFENQLVGVTMRRTLPHPAKWLHQPNGLLTRNYLYNFDNIEKYSTLILTEGVFDALNYWQNGYTNVVASFGSNLTDEQERLILQSAYDIILSYDNDSAGQIGTRDIVKRLHNKINIRVAELPLGKDPGELTREEIEKVIRRK